MIPETNRYGRPSLLSTMSAGVFTSIHHGYEIGYLAIALAAVVVVLPLMVMRWLRRTGSKMALWVYGLITTWLVIGFGIVDGFWNHMMRTLGYYYVLLPAHGGNERIVEKTFSLVPPEVGNDLFEATGVLTFLTGLSAAYYAIKFTRSMGQFTSTVASNI